MVAENKSRATMRGSATDEVVDEEADVSDDDMTLNGFDICFYQ
jgi:hypothetical protein